MAKPKTKKYKLGITTYNTEYVCIDISKKQYDQLKKRYDAMIKDNHANYDENNMEDSEFYIHNKETITDKNTFIEYTNEYCDGASYIDLFRFECKDGYKFTN